MGKKLKDADMRELGLRFSTIYARREKPVFSETGLRLSRTQHAWPAIRQVAILDPYPLLYIQTNNNELAVPLGNLKRDWKSLRNCVQYAEAGTEIGATIPALLECRRVLEEKEPRTAAEVSIEMLHSLYIGKAGIPRRRNPVHLKNIHREERKRFLITIAIAFLLSSAAVPSRASVATFACVFFMLPTYLYATRINVTASGVHLRRRIKYEPLDWNKIQKASLPKKWDVERSIYLASQEGRIKIAYGNFNYPHEVCRIVVRNLKEHTSVDPKLLNAAAVAEYLQEDQPNGKLDEELIKIAGVMREMSFEHDCHEAVVLGARIGDETAECEA